MKQPLTQRLQLLIIVVFIVTNLVLSGFIIVRSFAAQNQRQQTIEYIKCILLLSYDNPTLTPASPRAVAEAALDRCAKIK